MESPAPMWGEGRFQLTGPAKAVSEKEFQRSGHVGLISLPRKATSATWNASYVIDAMLRASRPYLNFHDNPTSEVLLCPGAGRVLRWAPRSISLVDIPCIFLGLLI